MGRYWYGDDSNEALVEACSAAVCYDVGKDGGRDGAASSDGAASIIWHAGNSSLLMWKIFISSALEDKAIINRSSRLQGRQWVDDLFRSMMRSKGGHERRQLHWKRRGEAAAALEKKRLEEEAATLEKKRLEVEAAAALEKKRRGLYLYLYWYCVGEAALERRRLGGHGGLLVLCWWMRVEKQADSVC